MRKTLPNKKDLQRLMIAGGPQWSSPGLAQGSLPTGKPLPPPPSASQPGGAPLFRRTDSSGAVAFEKSLFKQRAL